MLKQKLVSASSVNHAPDLNEPRENNIKDQIILDDEDTISQLLEPDVPGNLSEFRKFTQFGYFSIDFLHPICRRFGFVALDIVKNLLQIILRGREITNDSPTFSQAAFVISSSSARGKFLVYLEWPLLLLLPVFDTAKGVLVAARNGTDS